jgi:hypothetical protein
MPTEADLIETKKRLELLKMARQTLNDKYLKEQAATYVQWSTESDRLWKEQRIKLAFPPAPSMPTEADVVAYALKLYNDVTAQQTAPKEQVFLEIEKIPAITKPDIVIPQEPIAQGTISSSVKQESIEPVADIKTPDTVVTPISNPTPPPAPSIPEAVVMDSPMDAGTSKSAIERIFSEPREDLKIQAVSTPAPSVMPLIKGMLKKGLLPSWVKPDAENTK